MLTAEGKLVRLEWYAAQEDAGREIVTASEYENAQAMATAIERAPVMTSISPNANREVAAFWTDAETGVECKALLDVLDAKTTPLRPRIEDFKSSKDALRFDRAIGRYRYDMQAAFYMDGVQAVGGWAPSSFRWIVVEDKPPYSVLAAPPSQYTLEMGRELYKALLREYAAAMASGVWPGPESPDEWTTHEYSYADCRRLLAVDWQPIADEDVNF